MNDEQQLAEYRSQLIEIEGKAQADFDKAILTLSGGALGVSFAFVNDIIGSTPINYIWLLIASWYLWGGSLALILLSFFASQKAYRKAIQQLDEGKIRQEKPGGRLDALVNWSNFLSLICFIGGIATIGIFVFFNME